MPFAGGSGTVEDPYIITTVEQLQAMDTNLGAHYALGNDIDASDTINWNGGEGFAPVGGSGYFTGSLDGRGFLIQDLHIDRPTEDRVGMFSEVRGASIRNVRLAGASVYGHNPVGGLIGQAIDTIVRGCSVAGEVYGNGSVGGLCGYQWGIGFIEGCFSTGTVFGDGTIGGLVGVVSPASTNRTDPLVIDCYSSATVIGDIYVGGLIGILNGRIENCYSVGSVMAFTYSAGGLVALLNAQYGSVARSYWDVEASGVTVSQGGTGRSTAQMMQQATFVGWDFENVWRINEGNDYPRLWWEEEDDSESILAGLRINAGVTYEHNASLRIDAEIRDPGIIYTADHAMRIQAGAEYTSFQDLRIRAGSILQADFSLRINAKARGLIHDSQMIIQAGVEYEVEAGLQILVDSVTNIVYDSQLLIRGGTFEELIASLRIDAEIGVPLDDIPDSPIIPPDLIVRPVPAPPEDLHPYAEELDMALRDYVAQSFAQAETFIEGLGNLRKGLDGLIPLKALEGHTQELLDLLELYPFVASILDSRIVDHNLDVPDPPTGHYVQLGNGLLICARRADDAISDYTSNYNESVIEGAIVRSSLVSWPYPAQFAEVFESSVTGGRYHGTRTAWIVNSTYHNQAWDFSIVHDGFASNVVVRINAFAIGVAAE